MIGLAYLVFLVVYLAISIGVVMGARKLAGENKKSKRIAGMVAGIFMYMLVFWDLIPVLVQHKYLCETQAGFWVYKTPEEWIKENPDTVGDDWGSAEWDKLHKDEKLPEGVQRYWISSRVYNEIHRDGDFSHAISRREQQLIDSKTNQVLAKSIEFYRGSARLDSLVGYKVWLAAGHRYCGPDRIEGYSHTFMNNAEKLTGLGKGEK